MRKNKREEVMEVEEKGNSILKPTQKAVEAKEKIMQENLN